jgi:hypothetical protein
MPVPILDPAVPNPVAPIPVEPNLVLTLELKGVVGLIIGAG